MKWLRALDSWALRGKLLVTAGLTAPVIVALFLADEQGFPLVAVLGLTLWALAGFWIGTPAFLLVPLVAMAVEIAIGIPATLIHPVGESPVSVILEAPFWAGVPSLIAASIGGALRFLASRRTTSAAQLQTSPDAVDGPIFGVPEHK
jgi:hypothetical protein